MHLERVVRNSTENLYSFLIEDFFSGALVKKHWYTINKNCNISRGGELD
jgi:hypothetical protein